MINSEFQPDWLSPPGSTINDLLERRGLSREEFAKQTGYSLERISHLLVGRLAITPDIAQVLECTVGGSAQFWLAREDQYRDEVARLQSKGDSTAARAWLGELPVRDMVKFGWIAPTRNDQKNKLEACLSFFDVSDVAEWRTKYKDVMGAVAFRTSLSYQSQPGPVLAWLRYGELKASQSRCAVWNAKTLKAALPKMRGLTRVRDPKIFIPALKDLCAECGIALVIVRAPSRCHASGATRFISKDKAMMLLSFRHRSDDQFWFTFFHEIGHLLLHSRKALFIEDGSEVNQHEEEEANSFSQKVLVPEKFRQAVAKMALTKIAIMRLAIKAGISRGILVGQLQHMNRLQPNQFNYLKRYYTWSDIIVD